MPKFHVEEFRHFTQMYVRLIGLEPTRPKSPDPKSGASANFATGAKDGCKGSDIFSILKQFGGKFQNGIIVFDIVFLGDIHLVVRGDAKLSALLVLVVHGTGGEAHRPTVG